MDSRQGRTAVLEESDRFLGCQTEAQGSDHESGSVIDRRHFVEEGEIRGQNL